jgi:hypothetical protein
VTLTDAAMVRQLYATIYALPDMPAQRVCTDERGPHYTLAFREGQTPIVTVQAHRDGCRPVIISGQTPERKGTSAFWTQLDQAIYMATPPATPERLAIEYTPQPGKAPESALITSAAIAQRLYNAILALPLVTPGQECQSILTPKYQFAFFAKDQTIPAMIHDSCHSISLEGAYQSRGGEYAMNAQFTQVLQATLAEAIFAPARPDHLSLNIETYGTTSREENISDARLMAALYDHVFTLGTESPQPGCPPDADKIARKGAYLTFSFTQWSLPLLWVQIYEGSCAYAQISPTSRTWLQTDQRFWDLVHSAAGA